MSMHQLVLSQQPLLLESTRVWRTYTGGKLIETWQGLSNPQDGEFPEEWVASVVKARNTGREHIIEGLSKVRLKDGIAVPLKELVDSEPQLFLGRNHIQKYGPNTAVLVKMLDSQCRLSIQVHPDREFAKQVFKSQFGKTEAWHVLGGRAINGEPPYLLFGFKPGITREKWQELFEKQDIQGMVDCLHRIPAVPGTTLLIEGGVPHAIGPGCFLVEIQEPTDYTIRVERTTPQGGTIPDDMCHQGIGFDKIFNCFHYDGYSFEETMRRWRIPPVMSKKSNGFTLTPLISSKNTDKFSLDQVQITTGMDCENDGGFSILIVLEGSGRIVYGSETVDIRKSNMLFLPAGLEQFRIEANQAEPLNIMRCFPPK